MQQPVQDSGGDDRVFLPAGIHFLGLVFHRGWDLKMV